MPHPEPPCAWPFGALFYGKEHFLSRSTLSPFTPFHNTQCLPSLPLPAEVRYALAVAPLHAVVLLELANPKSP
jgi:hypothetical protein